MLQPTFDELAKKNGVRLDVGRVRFVVKDLGGPVGHTERDVIEISPDELTQPLAKQLYTAGHELTHVLQYAASPGNNPDARWSSMVNRYAADVARFGRAGAYSVSGIGGPLSGLDVLDSRFGLEGLATYVGKQAEGLYLDSLFR